MQNKIRNMLDGWDEMKTKDKIFWFLALLAVISALAAFFTTRNVVFIDAHDLLETKAIAWLIWFSAGIAVTIAVVLLKALCFLFRIFFQTLSMMARS